MLHLVGAAILAIIALPVIILGFVKLFSNNYRIVEYRGKYTIQVERLYGWDDCCVTIHSGCRCVECFNTYDDAEEHIKKVIQIRNSMFYYVKGWGFKNLYPFISRNPA